MWCTKLAVRVAYIGQSGISLVCHLKERRRVVFTGDSALAEHAMKSGHEIDWCQST